MPSESPAEIVPTSPEAARSHHAWLGTVVPRSRSAGAARATVPVMSGVSSHPMPGLGPARQLRTISAASIDGALRTVQHRLNEMFCVGWPRRCEISTGKRRHTQRVYQLGHELILAHRGRTELARPVEPAGKWRPPEVLTRTELAQAPITSRHRASPRLLRGADGIRTHDLLHGKQNVRSRASHESPGKERFPHQPARSRRTIGTMARPSLFARRSGRTAANGASTSARTMRGPRARRDRRDPREGQARHLGAAGQAAR